MIIGLCFCLGRLEYLLSLFWVFGFLGFWGMVWVWALGFGLSLNSLWSISVAPVRGGTYFSLPPQREVGKRKRLTPLILKRVPRTVAVVVHLESVFSHIPPQ